MGPLGSSTLHLLWQEIKDAGQTEIISGFFCFCTYKRMKCRIIILVTRHKLFHPVVILRVVPIPEYIVDYILIYIYRYRYLDIYIYISGASQEPEGLLWSLLCIEVIPGMLMGCSWRYWPFSACEAVLLMSSCRSPCMVLQIRVWDILTQ